MKPLTLRFLFSLFACTWLVGAVGAQTDSAALIARLKAYRFGGDRAVLEEVTRWVQESRSDPARRREAARELAVVLPSEAAFDAKQFVCRQLALIAEEEQVPALAGLLQDEQLADFALMALIRIPGETVNEALRRELPGSRGRARLGIITTMGDRRDTLAVPLLLDQLRSDDATLTDTAAAALARIGDPRAALALQQAYEQTSGERQAALGSVLLEYASRLQVPGDTGTALSVYEALDRAPAGPVQRAAALRGLVSARGEAGLPLLLTALGEDGTLRQSMAVRLAREMPGKAVTAQLCTFLPKLTPRGQQLLLEALGDRGDRTAVPAVMTLTRTAKGEVRLASLRTLGLLGDASTVPVLLQVAATGAPEEREAARAGLTRLPGRTVDTALLKALDSAQPALRVEIIKCLGQRHVTASVPRLIQEVRSPQRPVSTAAVRVLQDMGQPSHLPTLLALLLKTPAGARDEVMSAITEIARRGTTENQRTGVILQRLSAATTSADRSDLLSLLGEVGGPHALEALRKAAEDKNPTVQQHALRLLAEWPTTEPMTDLLSAARTSKDSRARTIALRGWIRMIGADEKRPVEDTFVLYKEAVFLARSADEKRLALSGLAHVKTLDALKYALSFRTDPALRAEAEAAAVEIARGTISVWREPTRDLLEPILRESTDENVRNRARDTLALGDKFGDFVTAWDVSPAYRREGANCLQLFDIPFPPERKGEEDKVPWRLMPAGTNPAQPWLLDLLALLGGEQCVAYMRSAVWSPNGGELILELGSDDGIKVWWNGEIVHANNTQRAVAPAQEKVTVKLRAGWNTLMIKVTQNVQGWGACARFTKRDGSPILGLLYNIPSSLKAGK